MATLSQEDAARIVRLGQLATYDEQIKNLIKNADDKKVDKVDGYGLSKNDYDDTEKAQVAANKAAIGDANSGLIKDVADLDTNKVDKVEGYGLSKNDYSDAEKKTVSDSAAEIVVLKSGASVAGSIDAKIQAQAKDAEYKAATEEKAAVSIADAIAALETAVGEGGSVSSQITAEIEKLDATVVSQEGTPDGDGIKVTVVETDGKLTSVAVAGDYSKTYDAIGSAAAVSGYGEGETAKTVKEVATEVANLGTAAKANVATTEIGTTGEVTAALPTVAQVKKYVTDSVANLEGATHFLGKFTALSEVTDPVAGDIAIVGTKEYIYGKDNTWVELGDETIYVTKTTTIAGVDLQNDITATEMKAALDIDDLETTVGDATSGLVKRTTDLETTVGNAASGLVKDVADLKTTVGDTTSGLVKDVDDLKTAMGSDSVADQITNAIEGLDSDKDQEAGADGLALHIKLEDGKVTELTGSIKAETYDTYGTATGLIGTVPKTEEGADQTVVQYIDAKVGAVADDLVYAVNDDIDALFAAPATV